MNLEYKYKSIKKKSLSVLHICKLKPYFPHHSKGQQGSTDEWLVYRSELR